MKLKELLENTMTSDKIKKQATIYKMTDELRSKMKEIFADDELTSTQADAKFMALCQTADESNNNTDEKYIAGESISLPGTVDSILYSIKKHTAEAAELPPIRVGDLVKISGVAFVKLDDGSIVDLHHKK